MITRYNSYPYSECADVMFEEPNGEWVKFDDTKELIEMLENYLVIAKREGWFATVNRLETLIKKWKCEP